MIGWLKGTLLSKHPPFLVVDINGVGYEVEAPMSTIFELPAEGQVVALYVHTHVREDAIQLFAFASEIERRFFRSLVKVNGVGAKMALAILSGASAETFAHWVEHEDTSALTKLPGVGKKTAERLIIEMRDRLDKEVFMGAAVSLPGVAGTRQATSEAASPEEEAVAALEALGYRAGEARKMVRRVVGEDMPTEEILRLALQQSLS